MTEGPTLRILISEVVPAGTGQEAARVHRRAALLARTGGGLLISPVIGDERIQCPGVRHLGLRVAPGLSRDALSAEVSDRVGDALDARPWALVHCLGLSSAIPALLRRRGAAAVVLEPGIMPSHWLRDHEPRLPAERLEDVVAMEDKVLSRVDGVVARSMIEAATLVRRGVAHERIHIAHDGVPLGGDTRGAPDLPHIVWMGDTLPWGGLALALEALCRRTRPWRLTALLPPEAPAGQLEARARALGVADRVTVSRDADHENVVSRLAAAAVVLCTLTESRSTQSGGVVPEAVLWAFAAGRSLVAPDLPIVRAYAGGAAQLYSPGDAGALAAALDAVLDDAELRARLAELAAERAAALTWESTEQAVADLWFTLTHADD